METRVSVFAAIVSLLASIAGPSHAYVLEGPRWPSDSNVVFRLGLGSAGRTLLDGNISWDTAAAPAFGMWNPNIQQTQLTYVAGASSAASGDGLNSVVFSTTVFGQTFGSNTLAVTYYRYSGSQMSEADILFNQNQNYDSYRGALRFGPNGYAIGEIRRVLLHELGHAMGLAHPDQHGQQVQAIMNSVISSRETLSSDDIAGSQSLYGAGVSPSPTPTPTPSTPTPTPTPRPTPTPTPTASPAPATLSLTVSPTRVGNGGSAIFRVVASVANPSPITVTYVMSGNAVVGTNYALSGTYGQVTIPAGSTSAQVTLTVLTAPPKSKKAKMTLQPGASYNLSAAKTATVTISR